MQPLCLASRLGRQFHEIVIVLTSTPESHLRYGRRVVAEKTQDAYGFGVVLPLLSAQSVQRSKRRKTWTTSEVTQPHETAKAALPCGKETSAVFCATYGN